MKACISKAVNFFLTEATTLTLLHAIETSAQAKLERLVRVAAEHTYVKSKSKCLPNTRDNTQRSILNLLKEAKSRFVWLRGSPGTGKTAISMSIASALEEEGTLAASFFWDKNQKGTGLDSLERFPSTLARQLALFDEDFKVLLIKCLTKPDSELVLSLDPKTQMKTLVLEPMNGLEGILSGSNKRVSIILDGLDECGDPEALESLMELVLLLHELPSAFAVLVSCRPEPTVLSAWNRARGQGLVIPCEDMDRIEWGDNFHTIRRMVEEELRDCITGSPWKPSDEDLDVFVGGCRGLPIMASIRIRDVCVQTRRGSSLQLEFEYFRSLREVPTDLNWEYLRIMRRAYLSDSSRIRPHVAKNYREIITMIITAEWKDLGTDDISHLLGITEHEVRTTLTPISSIVDLPESNEQTVKFYHATVKEFIMGVPIGEEQDKKLILIHINDQWPIGNSCITLWLVSIRPA
ncbi:uncharacterized protein EI90DRAFT_1485933 [Cantharellus anzutake]|uniref:uncharacterized protein n=1 Tax=Cantharellus anzutake TaxID=1750568 RepID=UPI0019087811|nr:uncharacterized protein EI90DRAFT_1485933 [Cantharellus anzutake]KAF8328872.1 hypothetical protein EI90DRAFT_1485933 [Cantharellus anzutake]